MNVTNLATIAAWLLIAGGVIAIFLPFAPSIPSIWLGTFIYSASHPSAVPQSFVVFVTIIAAATILLDYTLSKAGVAKLRAGPWGVFGAIVGGLLGSFFGLLGRYVIGPIIGAIVFELLKGRDYVYSFKRGDTTIVAFMGGTVIKLVAAIAIIGLFVVQLQR